ncbi:MAG: hypothetical protein HPM95_02200 [Alphaproteobacteria bacterium]|nr:hypothetical protein [Alphaproteobacteria bacterium]
MMAAEAEQAGLRLSSDIPLDLGEFTADPRACRQIALNLLANSVKFTPSGGRIVPLPAKEASGWSSACATPASASRDRIWRA